MDELGRKSLTEFKAAQKQPIVVILDNIRSMHNVGSVFRTADGFLLEGIILCGFTPQPPHRDIQKTALGATESVDWWYVQNTLDAVIDLKGKGYKVYAVEQAQGSISLEKFSGMNNAPLALVFGNEVEGGASEVIAASDGCIEIPQEGMKHSFNISVAAGIVLWEMVRTKQSNI
jgi:tRNA G18 (ribose-2'-O)-methylase SpoU